MNLKTARIIWNAAWFTVLAACTPFVTAWLYHRHASLLMKSVAVSAVVFLFFCFVLMGCCIFGDVE